MGLKRVGWADDAVRRGGAQLVGEEVAPGNSEFDGIGDFEGRMLLVWVQQRLLLIMRDSDRGQ